MIFISMKIVIRESQYKFLVEQTTPSTTPVPATTTPPTTTPPATGPKPMFGTSEQRAAAKAKREGQRKINFDNFVKGAFFKNFYEEIDDAEFNSSCQVIPNPEMGYIDGSLLDLPEFVYREQQNGSKIKLNLKKYVKYLGKQKGGYIPQDNLMGPNFKTNSKCGAAQAAAKQSKSDWKDK